MIGMGNPYVVAGGGDAWATEAAAAGRRGTQRLLGVRVTEAAEPVRSALELTLGELVVCRSRLMLLDDLPTEIADSFYPGSFAIGSPLASPAKIRGGAVSTLAELGRQAVEVTEMITARLPDKYEMDILAVSRDEPVLVLTRVSLDKDRQPVEYAVNRMIAGRSAPLSYRMVTRP
jgi:GntR family transcriptional regulator